MRLSNFFIERLHFVMIYTLIGKDFVGIKISRHLFLYSVLDIAQTKLDSVHARMSVCHDAGRLHPLLVLSAFSVRTTSPFLLSWPHVQITHFSLYDVLSEHFFLPDNFPNPYIRSFNHPRYSQYSAINHISNASTLFSPFLVIAHDSQTYVATAKMLERNNFSFRLMVANSRSSPSSSLSYEPLIAFFLSFTCLCILCLLVTL